MTERTPQFLQRDGFAQHPLPQPRTESPLGHDINASAEQILEIHQQLAEIEQTAARRHANQEIDVAAFIRLAAGDGPK